VLGDGTARVASQSNGQTIYRIVNGHCDCRDYEHAPESWCKHRLAHAIAKRAYPLAKVKLEASTNGQATPAQPAAPMAPEAPGLPESLKPYVVTLHGKPFVQYAGLLFLAHQRGLVGLKAHFISVTETLALAEAEATFADGQTYGECADSTPQNVGATVRAHFPRIALTRAKARVLCAVKAAYLESVTATHCLLA